MILVNQDFFERLSQARFKAFPAYNGSFPVSNKHQRADFGSLLTGNEIKAADYYLLQPDFTLIPAWNEIKSFDNETITTEIMSLLTEFISFPPGNDSFLSGNDRCSPDMDHFCLTFHRCYLTLIHKFQTLMK